jgi:hypothetical protein
MIFAYAKCLNILSCSYPGVNRIYPIGGIGFNVYCDWSTNNEGWTVRYYSLIDCCLTAWSNIPARTRIERLESHGQKYQLSEITLLACPLPLAISYDFFLTRLA